MITCKKCLSPNCRKNGKARQKQRYLCKECGYNVVTGDERKEKGISLQTREIAVQLYLLGLGLRAIGRFLDVSNVSVLNWVRAAGKKAEDVAINTDETLEVEIMELDEMWHYCKKKKRKIWLWLAICRFSKKIIAYQTGSRGVKIARKLWANIKDIPCQCYCSDHWSIYEKILAYAKHCQSQAEPYTIESYNALFRHYVARFHRRTKC